MSRMLTVACVAWFAATAVACLDVTPTPPSPAFEATLAAANDVDGGDDAALGSDGGDASSDGSDSSAE